MFIGKVDFWRKVRYSSVFPQNLSINNLTPHVLSEWMVEVCIWYCMWCSVYVLRVLDGVCVIQDMMFGLGLCLSGLVFGSSLGLSWC